MGWSGKIVGGLVGLVAGPVGALLGTALGHSYDVAAEARGRAAAAGQFQALFFDTVFAVMGFVAKSDGRVSEAEIAAARSVMREWRLDEAHTRAAMAAFTRGKQPDYAVDEAIAELVRQCTGRRDLLGLFIEIEMRAALAGDGLDGARRRLVFEIGRRCGFAQAQLQGLEQVLRRPTGSARSAAGTSSRPAELAQAFETLGIAATASDADVKKAYRRLMSEHHPDKLVARGLPESMLELAKVKTQRIREAYEVVAAERGIR